MRYILQLYYPGEAYERDDEYLDLPIIFDGTKEEAQSTIQKLLIEYRQKEEELEKKREAYWDNCPEPHNRNKRENQSEAMKEWRASWPISTYEPLIFGGQKINPYNLDDSYTKVITLDEFFAEVEK